MALVPPPLVGVSDPTIGIKIKTLDGGNGFKLDVAANISIRDLKAKLQSQTGLIPTRQRIIFRGKMLQENAKLSDYDVEDGHSLHLVARPMPMPSPIVAPRPVSPENEPPSIRPLAWSEAQRRLLVNAALSNSRLSALGNVRRERPTHCAEHLIQGLMTVKTLLSRAKEVPKELQFTRQPFIRERTGPNSASAAASSSSCPIISSPTSRAAMPHTKQSTSTTPASERTTEFYVGQWLDVKDTVNQWLEATVMEMSESKVFVHYNGWPNRWDEWIAKDSTRLAPFRSLTLHSTVSPYMCPSPVARLENSPITGSNDAREITSGVCDAMKAAIPLMQKLQTFCKASLDHERRHKHGESARVNPASTSSVEAEWEHSEDLRTAARQVAPLFDRLGRLMTDIAPFVSKLSLQRSEPSGPNSVTTAPDFPQPYTLGPANIPTSDPYSWLIATSNNPSRARQNNIDIHIHAILAPSRTSQMSPPPQRTSHSPPPAAQPFSGPYLMHTSTSGITPSSPITSTHAHSNHDSTHTSALDVLNLIRTTMRNNNTGNGNNNNENNAAANDAAAVAPAPAGYPELFTVSDDSDDESDIDLGPMHDGVGDDHPSTCSQQLD